MKRRSLLRSLGLVGAGTLAMPGLSHLDFSAGSAGSAADFLTARARAQGRKRVVFVRTLFDFRDRGRTTVLGDLAPLAPWNDRLTIVTGLDADGGGSEYHNGKQIRFLTSCTPTNRTGQSFGGGRFDGKSADVVVGEHLQAAHGSRVGTLILGAYPYTDSSLHTTFETVSFTSRLQYVRPEYDFAAVRTAIASYADFCGAEDVRVDVPALEREIRVLEAVMADLARSRRGLGAEVSAQVEALEAQYAALREDRRRAIANDSECIAPRTSPFAHTYDRHPATPAIFDGRLRDMNHTAALALATRYASAVTLNYSFSGHGQPGVPGYHDHTHPGGFARAPNGNELADLDGLSRFQVQMLAHLLRELADFGILDDTLVVYSPHERPTHDHADVPVVAINGPRPGGRASNLRVTDLNRDVLAWAGVPGADDFGGERSRGGVLT